MFTIKKNQSDFDRRDDASCLNKDIIPQWPEEGKFQIRLTSDDLYLPPGPYYFDIMLKHIDTGAVMRLSTFEFNIIGGPTNRIVNPGKGQLPIGETVIGILVEGRPIIIIAPTVGLNQGPPGPGVPPGGQIDAILVKTDSADFVTEWRKLTRQNFSPELLTELDGKIGKEDVGPDGLMVKNVVFDTITQNVKITRVNFTTKQIIETDYGHIIDDMITKVSGGTWTP